MRAIPVHLLAVVLNLAVVATAGAAVYVVSPDGAGDFVTIQEAVDAALDGDVIELTDGVFMGECNTDIDYLGKSITVRSRSGNPEACIIDCRDSMPRRGFMFHSGEDENAVLEGVTIRNGVAHGPC
jgi:hypothetical protein